MNILAASTRAKVLVDSILETTRNTYEWWSAVRGVDYGTINEGTWVRHHIYPTIHMIVRPDNYPEIWNPERLEGQSHSGSTRSLYQSYELDEEDQLKRWDKLIRISDGDVFYVVDCHPSIEEVHLLVSLLHHHHLVFKH